MSGIVQRLLDRAAPAPPPSAPAIALPALASTSPMAQFDQRLQTGLFDDLPPPPPGLPFAAFAPDRQSPGFVATGPALLRSEQGDHAEPAPLVPPLPQAPAAAADEVTTSRRTAARPSLGDLSQERRDPTRALDDTERRNEHPEANAREAVPPPQIRVGEVQPIDSARPSATRAITAPSLDRRSYADQLRDAVLDPATPPPLVGATEAPASPDRDMSVTRHEAQPLPQATPADETAPASLSKAISPESVRPEIREAPALAIPVPSPRRDAEPARARPQEAAPRIVEHVIREVPAANDAPRQPRPLSIDAISKIGKLPERRRAHTLFGMRRR